MVSLMDAVCWRTMTRQEIQDYVFSELGVIQIISKPVLLSDQAFEG
jgi:hypothetical protein